MKSHAARKLLGQNVAVIFTDGKGREWFKCMLRIATIPYENRIRGASH